MRNLQKVKGRQAQRERERDRKREREREKERERESGEGRHGTAHGRENRGRANDDGRSTRSQEARAPKLRKAGAATPRNKKKRMRRHCLSDQKRCVDEEAHQTSHDGREVAEQRRTLAQGRAKDDEEPKEDKGRRGR